MRKFTKHISICAGTIALCAAMTLGGCTSAPVQETSTAESSVTETEPISTAAPAITDGNYPVTTDFVKILGRNQYWKETQWLSLSGTGIEFTVTGSVCKVTLIGDSTAASTNVDTQARVAIYLNDERVEDLMMDEHEKEITVFEGKDMTDAVVRVVKLSESANSTYGISNVYTDGTIAPTPQKDLKIEFIGDSITCAYGVDDGLHGTFSTTNEDETKSYAYLTAQALDADYSMVSYSGYGICSGYTTGQTANTNALVPPVYDKLGNSGSGFLTGIKPSTLTWNFENWKPTFIVVNLGTNDTSYCKNDDQKKEFEDAYVEFLKQIRESNPDATIVCTLGIMGDTLYPNVENAVAAYKSATNDEKITSMKFDVQDLKDGYAVDYHPTPVTHEKAAAKLTEFLKTLM